MRFLNKASAAVRNVASRLWKERTLVVLIAIFSAILANKKSERLSLNECQKLDKMFFLIGYVSRISPDLDCMSKKHNQVLSTMDHQHSKKIVEMTISHNVAGEAFEKITAHYYAASLDVKYQKALERALVEIGEEKQKEPNK